MKREIIVRINKLMCLLLGWERDGKHFCVPPNLINGKVELWHPSTMPFDTDLNWLWPVLDVLGCKSHEGILVECVTTGENVTMKGEYKNTGGFVRNVHISERLPALYEFIGDLLFLMDNDGYFDPPIRIAYLDSNHNPDNPPQDWGDVFVRLICKATAKAIEKGSAKSVIPMLESFDLDYGGLKREIDGSYTLTVVERPELKEGQVLPKATVLLMGCEELRNVVYTQDDVDNSPEIFNPKSSPKAVGLLLAGIAQGEIGSDEKAAVELVVYSKGEYFLIVDEDEPKGEVSGVGYIEKDLEGSLNLDDALIIAQLTCMYNDWRLRMLVDQQTGKCDCKKEESSEETLADNLGISDERAEELEEVLMQAIAANTDFETHSKGRVSKGGVIRWLACNPKLDFSESMTLAFATGRALAMMEVDPFYSRQLMSEVREMKKKKKKKKK